MITLPLVLYLNLHSTDGLIVMHHKQALEYASNRCAVTTSTNLLLNDLQSVKDDESEGITIQEVHELVAQLLREPVESIDVVTAHLLDAYSNACL
ncbi:hypothetical protein ACUOA8_34875 [Escherichia sp. SS-MK2]